MRNLAGDSLQTGFAADPVPARNEAPRGIMAGSVPEDRIPAVQGIGLPDSPSRQDFRLGIEGLTQDPGECCPVPNSNGQKRRKRRREVLDRAAIARLAAATTSGGARCRSLRTTAHNDRSPNG